MEGVGETAGKGIGKPYFRTEKVSRTPALAESPKEGILPDKD